MRVNASADTGAPTNAGTPGGADATTHFAITSFDCWWLALRRQDSNLRRSAYETDALPTELRLTEPQGTSALGLRNTHWRGECEPLLASRGRVVLALDQADPVALLAGGRGDNRGHSDRRLR